MTAIVTFSSCNGDRSNSNVKGSDEISDVVTPDSVLAVDLGKPDSFAVLKKLQGAWGVHKNENAHFMIKGNKIVYLENLNNPFTFTITGDTLRYNYPGGRNDFHIKKLTADTLVLIEDGESKNFQRME